jgi:hypothetical protein
MMSTPDHHDGGPTIIVGWDGSAAARGAIAAGSRGIGATRAESGSVSSELLRTAGLPVLVIPPTAVHDLQEA